MVTVPERLVETCRGIPERNVWLERLPYAIREVQEKWSLSLGEPFDCRDVSCAWVAPVVRADGTGAVLKLGMPHFEGAHEIQGLRFWDGNPTVHVLEADIDLNAMLLEQCQPGNSLRELPEREQDVIVAGLLRRIWKRPAPPHPFRPLSAMTKHWAEETIADNHKWSDAGLVQEGLRLFDELSRPSADDVLLATDLHAGNVLRAQREPWLVIDPKPFVGDRAYDATQHLFNCKDRISAAPDATIERVADLLEVDSQRIRQWMFARSAAEPRDTWNDDSVTLARLLT
ncbi:MAG TPA: aminoglycoside phosphotransferase family protein [Blastocatellia bacterium]|nr:aminoglycoside phosphotransferase family protein [Blastocatellia bacterium]